MGISIVLQLLGFLALTVPVGFALGYVVFNYFLINGVPLTNLIQTIGQGVNNFTFLAVPFYIMAGQLMNTGGYDQRDLWFCQRPRWPYPGWTGPCEYSGEHDLCRHVRGSSSRCGRSGYGRNQGDARQRL